MNQKSIAMGLGFLLLTGNVQASGPGTTAANVLNMSVGARAIGMGEAFTSMADDISSLYWNPAGLAFLSQSEANFMYNQAYQDMNYNNAGMALSLENGALGGSLSYLGYGDIEGFDHTGTPTGNVDAYSGVATVGGGWLFDFGSMGFNTKVVQGALADEKAMTAAFDFGGTYVHPAPVLGNSTLRVGAAIRNLGPGMKFLQQKDPLPTEWRLGTSLMQLFNQKLNLSVDYGKARGNTGALYAGGEYWVIPFVALRAGYTGNHTESNGLRAGLGLKIKDISFDYAFASYGDLGLTHRYELLYRFGDIRPRLTPEQRKLLRQAKRAIRIHEYAQAVLLLDGLIKTQPKYKLFHKLYKVALNGNEKQENLAKGQNNFNVLAGQRDRGTLYDLEDIEQLLTMSDQAIAQSQAKSKKLPGDRQ
jgi:hypothetical protein